MSTRRGITGGAPISTGIKVGLDSFYSFLDGKSKSMGSSSSGRSYLSTTRGMIAIKDMITSGDYSRVYKFQFNPQTVTDNKSTNWEEIIYAGLPYVDLVWGSGGVRTVSFQLFLDNTPQSKHRYFVGNGNEGEHINPEGEFSSNGAETIKTNNKGFSASRYDERGVLDEVEFFQSFMYPAVEEGVKTPKFTEGGIINLKQFRPPNMACLALGPIYLEGIVRSVNINYSLFDKDLTPIRATVDIEMSIFEFYKPTKLEAKTTKL